MTEDDARTQQTGGGFEHWGFDLKLPDVQDAVVETLERFRKIGDITDGAEIRHKDTELLQARTLRTGGGVVTDGATHSRGGGGGGRRRRRGLGVTSGPRRTARPPHGERPAREKEAAAAGVGGPPSSQAAGGWAEAARPPHD